MTKFKIRDLDSGIPVPPVNPGGRPLRNPEVVEQAAKEKLSGKFKTYYSAAKYHADQYYSDLKIEDLNETKYRNFAKKIKEKCEELTNH